MHISDIFVSATEQYLKQKVPKVSADCFSFGLGKEKVQWST